MVFILSIVLLTLFSAQIVSALEFDNVKSYDEINREVTIKNVFGLGDNIAKVKLITPLKYNVIDKGEGIMQKVAEFEITNNKNYFNVFKEMEFFDLDNLDINVNRNFIYKKKIKIGEETINKYEEVCEDGVVYKNGSLGNECSREISGKYNQSIYKWVDLENELINLNEGIINVGIFTDVKKGDNIEWIPTLYGVRIEEWAVWSESLNLGLDAYYKLNETTGSNTLESVYNLKNGTLQNMENGDWVTGLIGNALEFGGTDEWINVTPVLEDGISEFSVSFWINTTSINESHIIDYGVAGSGERFVVIIKDGNTIYSSVHAVCTIGNLNTTNIYNDSKWHQVVFTINSSNYGNIYFDGNQFDSGSCGASLNNAGGMRIGKNIDNTQYYNGLLDEIGLWNRSLSSSEITDLYNSGNGISYNNNFINTTLISPSSGSTQINETLSLVVNSTSSMGELKNVTLYVWNSSGGIVTTETQKISGSYNLTTFSVLVTNYDTYSWNALSKTPTISTFASSNSTLIVHPFKENSESYNTSTTETKKETFEINISTNGSESVTGNLIYNGTSYSGTKTGGNSEMVFSKTWDIPIGNVTNSFHWNITVGSNTYSTTSNNQSVNLLNYSLCGGTNNIVFMNTTFKDETSNVNINASIPTSSWIYYLGDGSVNKTYTYINTGEELNYTFCLTPTDETLKVDYMMQYESTGYPQRTFEELLSLTNSTTEKILYLLTTGDGQYVTFQVINSAEQVISGVFVNATRTISGSEILIGSGNTDASGTITFWMNPNFAHQLAFDRTGYDLYTTSLTPTQSSYTIQLGGSTTPIAVDYTKGIEYSINPTNDLLDNNTNYVFNFTLSSSYWDITEFGFILTNSTGSNLDSSIILTNGGTATTTFNTGNHSEINMEFYWVAESNYTNGTRSWLIYDDTTGNDWSILNFITLVKTYKDDGMFGLDDFGVAIITFIIIFIIIGIMAFKFGFDNEVALIILFASLVAIADFGFNLFPSIGLGTIQINHIATIIVVLISITILIMEARR